MASSASADGATVVVACAADAAYVVPLAAMLRSALASLRPGATLAIHVVDAGIAAGARERLDALAREHGAALRWHEPLTAGVAGLPTWGRMPSTTYQRLLVTDHLPGNVNRAIWLDCDLLVSADLGRLWEADLRGSHLLAVRDSVVPLVSSRYGIARWRELGFPREAPYFNAGVMLVDLDRWRDDEIGDRAARYLREYRDDVVFWDQEGLNAALCGRWGELDQRWNRNVSEDGRGPTGAARPEPWIVHFNGTLKPWLLPEPPAGARALFFRHLDRTPWEGWRPARTPKSATLGWYESSRLRDVMYPVEPWVMLSVRNHLRRRSRRRDT
jgi:lipopolysaccharide biosynthesis glycosyltransferase